MNWHLRSIMAAAPEQTYWLPARDTEQYPVGHMLKEVEVFEHEGAAEHAADAAIGYSSSRGLPIIYPIRAHALRRAHSQYGWGFRYFAQAQIIGPPKYTAHATVVGDQKSYMHLFRFNGSSSGYDDTPAGNPGEVAEWSSEFPVAQMQRFEPILRGGEVCVQVNEDGSYHDRWIRGHISISLTDEQEMAVMKINPDVGFFGLDRDRKLKVKARFPFTTFAEMISKVQEETGVCDPEEHKELLQSRVQQPQFNPLPDATKPKPGQTPEEYHAIITEMELMKKRKRSDLSGD